MNDKEIKPLSTSEYEKVGDAIFSSIVDYPELKEGMQVDYQDLKSTNCIGFFTSPGGKYLSENVIGGFTAQLPFDLVYKFTATADGQRIEAESFLNKLVDWMEQKPYPLLTDGRTIEKIIFNSTTYRTEADNDGSIKFVRSGIVRYEKD